MADVDIAVCVFTSESGKREEEDEMVEVRVDTEASESKAVEEALLIILPTALVAAVAAAAAAMMKGSVKVATAR